MSFFSFWKKVPAQISGAPSLPRFCFCGKDGEPRTFVCVSRMRRTATALLVLFAAPVAALAQQHFNGTAALEYTRQFVAIGPRFSTSSGHTKAEAFLRDHFRHDQLEEDAFTASTPIGPVAMRNFIVRFPGKKSGVIVLATH